MTPPVEATMPQIATFNDGRTAGNATDPLLHPNS